MSNKIKVKVENLNLYYGENHALKDVNMDIQENAVTAFIGPSGCGKSTFLKTLNRMNDLVDGVRIDGKVLLDGEDIYDPSVDTTILRKKVGMVFQQPNPFPMSIYDNIAYGPRVHGIRDKKRLDQIVEESLRGAAIFDEVKDRLKKSAMGLSGGQQQRICIARALAVQPEVLLMDEPTSALDPISTANIEELMEDLKKKNGADMNDKEIVFSKSIKAGKRIYYLDVKKNRKDEMFLAITESKKVVTGEGEDLQVSFEKHKIFLYREDFEKFMNGLNEAIDFINRKEMLEVISDMNAEADENAEAELDAIAEMNTKGMELDGEIKIDIDFEEPTL